MTKSQKELETERLVDQAIRTALGALLRLVNPDDDNVNILPDGGYLSEREWRLALRPYIGSWAAGPLADAIARTNLPSYSGNVSADADRYVEETTRP